jgi:hypothetical protein
MVTDATADGGEWVVLSNHLGRFLKETLGYQRNITRYVRMEGAGLSTRRDPVFRAVFHTDDFPVHDLHDERTFLVASKTEGFLFH